MKLKKYNIAIILGILAVVAVALFDLRSATSGVFGSYCQYTQGNYTEGWWSLFEAIVLFSFAIVPLCYYIFYKRDLSESIAIYITSYTMWMFGLADIFYFWLQGKAVPAVLPWLSGNPIISKVASIMGSNYVTPLVLIVSVLIGGVIVFFSTKFLEKIN